MAFQIPFEIRGISHISDVFIVKSSKKCSLVAFVTQKSVLIRDSQKIDCPHVITAERTQESLNLHGPNNWFEWIDKSAFAYGTCSGVVMIQTILDGFLLTEPIYKQTDISIVSTFSSLGYIGLCSIDSSIFFLSRSGDIISRIYLNKAGQSIRNAIFHYPSTLSCIVGGTPCISIINRDTIEKNEPFLYKYEEIGGIKAVSYNPYRSLIAHAGFDNSVSIAGVASRRTEEKRAVLSPSNDDIIKMEWIAGGKVLLVIQDSGKSSAFNVDVNKLISIRIPNFNNVLSVDFDFLIQQLLCTDFTKIFIIDFAETCGSLFITPTSVFDSVNCQCIFSIKNDYMDLFPICKAVFHEPKIYCISSLTQCFVFNDSVLALTIKEKVQNFEFMKDMLFVFYPLKNGNSIPVIVYSLNGQKLSEFGIQHNPSKISVFNEKICVSSSKMYTIISVSVTPTNVICGSQYLKIETIIPDEPVQNVLLMEAGNVLLHLKNNNILQLPEKIAIADNIKYAFSQSSPPSVFLQKDESILLFSRRHLLSFDNWGVFANNNSFFWVNSNSIFGQFSFESRLFAPSLLMQSMDNAPDINYFVTMYRPSPLFETIFTDALLLSFIKGNTSLILDVILGFKPDETAKIIVCALFSMKEEHKKMFLKMSIEWATFFRHLRSDWQHFVLVQLPHIIFLDTIHKIEKSADDHDIIQKLSQSGAVHRAYIYGKCMESDPSNSVIDPPFSWVFRALCGDYKIVNDKDLYTQIATDSMSLSHFNTCFSALFALSDEKYMTVYENCSELQENIRDFLSKSKSTLPFIEQLRNMKNLK